MLVCTHYNCCQSKQKQKLCSGCTGYTSTPNGDMVKPVVDPPSSFLSCTWWKCSHQGMGLNLAKHNTLKLKQWSWKQLSTKCFEVLICSCCTRLLIGVCVHVPTSFQMSMKTYDIGLVALSPAFELSHDIPYSFLLLPLFWINVSSKNLHHSPCCGIILQHFTRKWRTIYSLASQTLKLLTPWYVQVKLCQDRL